MMSEEGGKKRLGLIVMLIVGLFIGVAAGYTAKPTPEPEIVTETVERTVTKVVPEEVPGVEVFDEVCVYVYVLSNGSPAPGKYVGFWGYHHLNTKPTDADGRAGPFKTTGGDSYLRCRVHDSPFNPDAREKMLGEFTYHLLPPYTFLELTCDIATGEAYIGTPETSKSQ